MSRGLSILFGSAALGMVATGAMAQTGPDTVSGVIVTASPLSGEGAALAGRAGRGDILAAGGASLADALKGVPGVSGTGFSAGSSRPVIRGMDSYRVKVLENGLSSADVSDIGPDHGVPIEPLSTDVIEVVRGAATLRYGGQAIGGVVNAINGRIPVGRPSQPLSAELVLAGDDGADSREAAARIEGAAGSLVWRLDGSSRRTADYDTPLGPQANSFFRGQTYGAGASWLFNDANRAGLSAEHYGARYGIPAEDSHIEMRQDRYSLESSLAAGPGRLNIDATYGDYRHNEVEPGGAVASTFVNHEWDGRAEWTLGPLGPLSSTALGVQANRRDFSGLGAASDYLLPTRTRTAAAFGFTRLPLAESLDLEAAARLERVEVSGTPASGVFTERAFSPASASAGLVWRPAPEWKLAATLSSTARAPAQAELFAHGPHDGPQTFETGDPSLGSERARSAELNARWIRGGLRLEGSLWTSRFDHYVYGALTGRTCDDAGACAFGPPAQDLRELNYAQTGARFRGAEFKAAIPLTGDGEGLSLTLLADVVRAELSGGLGAVPRLPPHRLGGGLSWTSGHFDAGFTWLRVGKQDRPGTGDTPTAGYDDLDLRLAWRPLADNGRLEIDLVGKNLTDVVQRNAASLNKDLVIQPGRNVRLVARMKF